MVTEVAGVTEQEWFAALDEVLAEVAAELPGAQGTALAAAVRHFVVAGAGAPPSATPAIAHALDVLVDPVSGLPGPETAQARLVAGLPAVGADVALRWLVTLAAASRWQAPGGTLDLPGGARWPLELWRFAHADAGSAADVDGDLLAGPGVPLRFLETLEAAAGWVPGTTLASALSARGLGYGDSGFVDDVVRSPGLADAMLRNAALVTARFGPAVGVEGLNLARALAACGSAVLSAYTDLAAVVLASSSKQTRAAAAPLLRLPEVTAPGPVRDALARLARDGSVGVRSQALVVLHDLATAASDDARAAEVRAVAAADPAPAVRRLADGWAAVPAVAEPAGDAVAVEPPPPVVVDWRVDPAVLRPALAQMWEFLRQQVDEWNEEARNAPRGSWFATPASMPDERTWADLTAYLASDAARPPRPQPWVVRALDAVHAAEWFLQFAGPAGRVGAVKWAAFFGEHRPTEGRLVHLLAHEMPDLDLRTLEALVAPFGGSPRDVLVQYVRTWGSLVHLGEEAVRPFLVEHVVLVDEMLREPPSWDVDRERLFACIDLLPSIPPLLVRTLFDLALGTGKRDRPLAQKALARVEGKSERVVAALSDGKAEVRSAAARWLGDLGDRSAVPALESLWRKEKQDVVRAVALDALEALGRPAEAYLDLDGLLADAARTAAKPLPPALDWVPWDVLPAVRWAQGTSHAGEPVPLDLVRHLAVQAVKAKSPAPNALLRRYCALWDRADGQALAVRLLEGWLAHDVTPISRAEAEQRADAEAGMWHSSLTSHPQYHAGHPWLGWSREQIVTVLLPSKLTIPAGSAIDSKGLLALVAATAGGDVAPPVNRYLKQWFGHRAPQAKVLIGMLAHVDHPAATALLLSVGNRFRTKGIQDEANRLAAELAERHGWTVDELADRTIPSAGLDEDGVLALDYGPRRFTAVLAPDLTLGLRSPDGAALKALPAARSDDDADLVAAAKKALAAAKKELKATVEQQTSRLYEAMCTGRDWSFDDWNRYLAGHPVVRHLVQRLVWAQAEAGDDATVRVVRLFRPLDDGTLTGADDDQVTVPPDARIRLAHDAFVPADDVAAWTTHLADYEVAPLFAQLGTGYWTVPPGREDEAAVEDFVGHVVEAFALRGRAARLGWSRGESEDGGVFTTYRKRFASLGLDAVVGFTGNTLPEENRTVALGALHVERVADAREPWNARPVRLGDVPPVLLSECRNDVRLMAADGEGFRADWEKLTQLW